MAWSGLELPLESGKPCQRHPAQWLLPSLCAFPAQESSSLQSLLLEVGQALSHPLLPEALCKGHRQ